MADNLTKAHTERGGGVEKRYVYIGRYKLDDPTKCKIGIAQDLQQRLSQYNSATGISKSNPFAYIFTCEVKNASQVENDIKNQFSYVKENPNSGNEIYFYNPQLFPMYVNFIKSHILFVKELSFVPQVKERPVKIKIVRKVGKSLVERGLTKESIMKKARKADNDEFYTRLEDVEKELNMYPVETWRDKVVFCNCDDAVDNDRNKTSAFALYFLQNFQRLGLKKLICTHYSGGLNLFNAEPRGYIFEKDGFKNINDYELLKRHPRGYTGSFDEPISKEILEKEADIVCTNPPFSRAIEYWDLVVNSGKKFIIISNFTNTITTAFIPYFKNRKAWAGYNRVDWFLNPKKEKVCASGHWYCNIIINDRPRYKNMKFMPLSDIPKKYKSYDDNKMLLVDNNYVPNDYKGQFAVSAYPILSGVLEKGFSIVKDKQYIPYKNGKAAFARTIIKKD